MKKLTLTLVALLALTACTAAPESRPTPTETPAATEATTEESAAAFPVGTLRLSHSTTLDTDTTRYCLVESGTSVWPVIKTDYAAAAQTAEWDFDVSNHTPVAMIPQGEDVQLFLVTAQGESFGYTTLAPDGGTEEHTLPQRFYPNVYDEYAAYDMWETTCRRLDWATGEITTFSMPFREFGGIYGVVDGKLLVSRVVADMPIPYGDGNEEMVDAVLQNSQREYALYDLATNTTEKVFDEPYYTNPSNEQKRYLGWQGSKLYFTVQKWSDENATHTENKLCSFDRSTGEWQEESSAEGSDGSDCQAFTKDGQMKYALLWRGNGDLVFYRPADGARYTISYDEPQSYGQRAYQNDPIAMTNDGRMLVTDGWVFYDGVPSAKYALIDLDDYLAGSTDYTKVQMWEG